MNKDKVLLIDDDIDILEINKKFLERENFKIYCATSAAEGLSIIHDCEPHCIVLDLMMPRVNGLVACKKYRTVTNAPIIFLTGCTSEEDKIKSFLLGADDYLEKPYSLKELQVRILANIRRSRAYNTPDLQVYQSLSLDISLHKAYCNGEEILLSNREFELLYMLIKRKNETVTFEDIGVEMFGVYSEADRRSVMVHMSRLRKKLKNYPDVANMIQTVWSEGYCFSDS